MEGGQDRSVVVSRKMRPWTIAEFQERVSAHGGMSGLIPYRRLTVAAIKLLAEKHYTDIGASSYGISVYINPSIRTLPNGSARDDVEVLPDTKIAIVAIGVPGLAGGKRKRKSRRRSKSPKSPKKRSASVKRRKY